MKNTLVNIAVLAVSSISLAAVAAPAHMTKKVTAVVTLHVARAGGRRLVGRQEGRDQRQSLLREHACSFLSLVSKHETYLLLH